MADDSSTELAYTKYQTTSGKIGGQRSAAGSTTTKDPVVNRSTPTWASAKLAPTDLPRGLLRGTRGTVIRVNLVALHLALPKSVEEGGVWKENPLIGDDTHWHKPDNHVEVAIVAKAFYKGQIFGLRQYPCQDCIDGEAPGRTSAGVFVVGDPSQNKEKKTHSTSWDLLATHVTPNQCVTIVIPEEVKISDCADLKIVITIEAVNLDRCFAGPEIPRVLYEVVIPIGPSVTKWETFAKVQNEKEFHDEVVREPSSVDISQIPVAPGGDFVSTVHWTDPSKMRHTPVDDVLWCESTSRSDIAKFRKHWTHHGFLYGTMQIISELDAELSFEDVVLRWRNHLEHAAAIQGHSFWKLTWSQHKHTPFGPYYITQLENFLRGAFTNPKERQLAERYAMEHCQYDDFKAVLDICIKYSYNPLHTTVEAFKCCRVRQTKADYNEVKHNQKWQVHAAHVTEVMQCLLQFLLELEVNTINTNHLKYHGKPQGDHDKHHKHHIKQHVESVVREVVLEDMVSDLVEDVIENKIDGVTAHPVIVGVLKKYLEDQEEADPLCPYKICEESTKISALCLYFCHFASYLVFVILLALLIAQKSLVEDPVQITWRGDIVDTFFGDPSDSLFYSIHTADDVWNWVSNVLLPGTLEGGDPYYHRTKYLAYPEIVLRQFRVDPIPCPDGVTGECYPAIDLARLPTDLTYKNTTWQTFYVPELKGTPFPLYPAAGYAAIFNTNSTYNAELLQQLITNSWIDGGTCALFVDFWLGVAFVDSFARVSAMIEFTNTGAVNLKYTIDTIWVQYPIVPFLVVLIILIAILFGYACEEITAIYLKYRHSQEDPWYGSPFSYKLSELRVVNKLRKARQPIPPHERPHVLLDILKEHLQDPRNALDLIVIFTNLIYVVAYVYVRVMVPSHFEISPEDFDYFFSLGKFSEVVGSIGVITAFFRLLYFSLSIESISSFILGVQSMIPIAGQFLLGFSTIVVGFGAGLNLLYGSLSESWSSLHQFFSSFLNAFTGYGNTVTNENFTPYAYLWVGDIFLVLYLILTSIICINMLIAMMGNEFNYLVQHQILKRKAAFARGDMYLQAKQFLLPSPFNIFHLMVLGAARCCDPNLKFHRWLPHTHKPAYLHTILLKEMYLEYRSGMYAEESEDEEREIEVPDDSESDDTTNAKRVEQLKPFVEEYIRKTFRSKPGEESKKEKSGGEEKEEEDEKKEKEKEEPSDSLEDSDSDSGGGKEKQPKSFQKQHHMKSVIVLKKH